MTEIEVRRLEWLGHVITMEDTRLQKWYLMLNQRADVELEDLN
jgi:hypothetical protein